MSIEKEKHVNTKLDYWLKALKWYFGNLGFGLFPLILMGSVNWLTKGKDGHEQVDHLIYEGGVILFVLIGGMGAVAIDYLISGIKAAGRNVFYIYLFPAFVLGFVSLEFLLVCLGRLEREIFNINSYTTIVVLLMSFIYCTFAKANLYLKEDSNAII